MADKKEKKFSSSKSSKFFLLASVFVDKKKSIREDIKNNHQT
jgi:hypothetical protein